MGKLKIAHIVSDLLSGGGQKSTIDLIRTTDENVENYMILLEDKRAYEVSDIKTMYVCKDKKIYKKLDTIGDYLLSIKLAKILKEHKIDIAISHMEVTAKVLRFVDITKVYYMRSDITKELETLYEKSVFRFLKRKKLYKNIFSNQNIITISKDSENSLLEIISPKRIETIYNPFDFEKIKNLSNDEYDGLNDEYIVQIGSGIKVKRQDVLVKAFAKVEDKNIKLLLLGTDRYDELLELIKSLNLEDRVVFYPYTTNPYPFIKNAKLLVVSSQREGLPRVIVESLALNTPVASTDCDTGPREVLVNELSAYLANVNDSDDLAKRIDSALESYPEISDKYIEKFNKNKIGKKFFDFVKDLNHI